MLNTSEDKDWDCKGYVVSERLVQAGNTNAFSASGISLDSKNKKISINGATINSAYQTYQFRIESTLVSGTLSGSTVSYLGNQVKVYSPVITVSPQPRSVTFRYYPNGGNQPDNYVTWVVNPSSSFPDNHWNYANSGDAYYMTRTGYTATGDYAEADGSCSYHQDENFTSYADLCAKYGVNINTKSTTIDIYAQWQANSYTASFDPNGGSVDTGSKSVTYDSTYGDLPTPTRDGHTFNGWFTAAEGGTQVTNATKVTTASNHTLYAQWTKASYTVTWKNDDGTVLGTDNGLTYGTTPEYNGDTPIKPEDEEFTYTFSGWSPEPSPVTGNAEYTAQFTANSKRVEPTYTVTIPATAKVGEEITISATDVVMNEDETLTVTLQSDFKLYMGQDVALPFVINGGSIQNNAVILSITGNCDQTAPQSAESTPLTVTPAEDPPYAGTYTGTIHFTIAVTTAGNN